MHTPETAAEKIIDGIRKKTHEHGLEFPVVVDGNHETWQAWSNSMWPSVYLIDKEGRVRYWWYGELNWQGSEGEKYLREKIEDLLNEK